ncbi:hypothetical protein KC330_g7737 [Hortaea werneckii]|nr:hypothetical protein KC330_g7737 [Hortaea werneckii]
MSFLTLLPVALLAGNAIAQTSTTCDPLNSTCPDDAALGTTFNHTWTAEDTVLNSDLWNVTAGTEKIQFTKDGAELVISESGDSVTAESSFHIFWGTVEVIMKAASGTGIISTFDLLSDDLDEIDLECFGGNESYVGSNWYGHGNTSQHNGGYHQVDGPQNSFHNYTFVWTQENLQWLIDGDVARTVDYAESGKYPQTPSRIKFGIWAGGDSSQPQGTIDWAGGETNWDEGPFTMTIQSMKIVDGTSNVTSYAYSDQSGDYSSITTEPGNSKAYNILNQKSTTEQAKQKWDGLSTGAKVGIACGVIGAVAIGILAWCTFCIFQRRKGKKERLAADAEWDKEQAELQEYQVMMRNGKFAMSSLGHGQKF